jgi:peptide chain release factor 3
MAANTFNLQYEMDRYKGIQFSDVKDYQKKAA